MCCVAGKSVADWGGCSETAFHSAMGRRGQAPNCAAMPFAVSESGPGIGTKTAAR